MNKQDWPAFDEAMEYSLLNLRKIPKEGHWITFEKNYNNYKQKTSSTSKIPKIIHQIWLGGQMPHAEFERCQAIEKSLPLDWKYKLWTDKDISELTDFFNKDIFDASSNYGQKSDILRYYLLHKYGGIYCDTDFIFLKSFDQILDVEFFCGIAYDAKPNVQNCIIGSSPGNNLISDLQNFDKPVSCGDAMEVIDTTGPYHITRKVFKHEEMFDNILFLPTSFVFPFPNFTECQVLGKDYTRYIKPESFCCHLWACSWFK